MESLSEVSIRKINKDYYAFVLNLEMLNDPTKPAENTTTSDWEVIIKSNFGLVFQIDIKRRR